MPRTGEIVRPGEEPPQRGLTTKHTNLHEKSRGRRLVKSLMAKLLKTTIERQGGREKEQSKVGPKGEGVEMTKSNDTDIHNQAPGQVCGRLPEGSPEGETSGNERIK